MNRIIRRIGIFVLAAFFLAPAALAQGNQGQQPPPPQPAPDVEVNDAELKTVAETYLEIETLQKEYGPKMQGAEDQTEAQQIQTEFQQKVTEKLEAKEDITPQRFGTIMRAAQADEELQNQLLAAIQEARGDSLSN